MTLAWLADPYSARGTHNHLGACAPNITEPNPIRARGPMGGKRDFSSLRDHNPFRQRLGFPQVAISKNGISGGPLHKGKLKPQILGHRLHLDPVQLRLDLARGAAETVAGQKADPAWDSNRCQDPKHGQGYYDFHQGKTAVA